MSKASELRVLKYGRSADAPIQHHHRTGDTEGASGTMLDIYAQAESAEDLCLQEEDEQAKAVFLRGFSGYMQKVFSPKERKFLSRLMSGKEKPREVGKALGVDWFHFMQALQHKAYKNTAPLLRLVELSGWTQQAKQTRWKRKTLFWRIMQSTEKLIEKPFENTVKLTAKQTLKNSVNMVKPTVKQTLDI